MRAARGPGSEKCSKYRPTDQASLDFPKGAFHKFSEEKYLSLKVH